MINPSHGSGADLYYNRDRPSLRAWIAQGPNRVLDLGCGSGAIGKKLLDTGAAAEVVGVEIFPGAAQQAAGCYRQVHVGDIEQMELPYGPEFDYAVCGDILEHLKDPYALVRRIRGWLKQGGWLVCSVPNVRHWRVIADLVCRGAWEYCDAGIMDRTHLRFFTRRSCFSMLQNGGFVVEGSRILISGRKYSLLDRMTFGLFEELLGSQIVVKARKNK